MKTTDENQPKQWKQWTVIVPIAGYVVMTVTAKTERGAEKEALRQLNAGMEYEDLEWDRSRPRRARVDMQDRQLARRAWWLVADLRRWIGKQPRPGDAI